MATPYDYFSIDGVGLGVASVRYAATVQETQLTVQTVVHRDNGVGASYLAYYVPHTEPLLRTLLGLLNPGLVQGLLETGPNVVFHGFRGEHVAPHSQLPFSHKVVIYTDDEIAPEEWDALSRAAQAAGLFVSVRGPECARIRTEGQHAVGFLSHDSRDKESIAYPMAFWLKQHGAPVWFDEFSLPVGASIAGSIDKGMRDTEKAILLITPNYLENTSWAETEMNTLLGREVGSGSNRLIPVWWNVTHAAVANRSPLLADRKAFVFEGNVDKIYSKLFHQLTGAYAPIPQVVV